MRERERERERDCNEGVGKAERRGGMKLVGREKEGETVGERESEEKNKQEE